MEFHSEIIRQIMDFNLTSKQVKELCAGVLQMSIDLEEIHSRNPIENIVAKRFPFRKSGSCCVGMEHDSLVLTYFQPIFTNYFARLDLHGVKGYERFSR